MPPGEAHSIRGGIGNVVSGYRSSLTSSFSALKAAHASPGSGQPIAASISPTPLGHPAGLCFTGTSIQLIIPASVSTAFPRVPLETAPGLQFASLLHLSHVL